MENEFALGADISPNLVNEALHLMSAILISNSNCLQAFVKRNDLPQWLVALVLKAQHHWTREYGARGLSSLAQRITASPYVLVFLLSSLCAITSLPTSSFIHRKLAQQLPTPPSTFFLNLLLPALTEIEQYAETCDQYFMLLESLLKDYDNSKELLHLVKRLARSIIRHPVVETHATAGPEDKVLIGLMRLVLAILRRDSAFKSESTIQSLIPEVFHKCLFAIPTATDHGTQGRVLSLSIHPSWFYLHMLIKFT